MENLFIHKLEVLSSQTDMNAELGLTQTLNLTQDNMCDFLRAFDCDGPHMIPSHNCFFVMSKTKIHINKFLYWQDKFDMTSKVIGMSKIRLNLQTVITDESGEEVSTCVHELCAVDAGTRRPRLIGTTNFPEDLKVEDSDFAFSKLDFDLDESCLVDTLKIGANNIDFYHHTNNVEYVRLMINNLGKDFYVDHIITDCEINYIAESKFGEEIKIYRKDCDGYFQFAIKKDDKVITKATISYSSDFDKTRRSLITY